MKKQSFLLLFIVFISQTLFAQTALQNTISALEMKRFTAMTQKDTVFLKKVLSDGLVYTHSNALVESKQSFLESIKTGKIVYKSMESEEMKVRILDKTAIINGIVKVSGSLNDKEFTLRLRYTDVYHKNKGGWQLEAWQSLKL
jgi:hypothetical protein